MIGITNAGGGKDRLQFRLFAGQNPPNNPKTNDVFVRTNVLPVNEWQLRGEGHPLGWLEKENDIVIQTDSTPGSPIFVDLINDTRGGRIYETFKSCVQQVSGKWVKREAYIWWANRWQQFSWSWNGELFYQGNQYTEHTGGWTGMVRNPSVSPSVADPANPNLFCDANGVEGGTAWIRTVNKVDMTNYRTLKWTGWGFGENSGSKYAAQCSVHDNPSTGDGVISSASFQNEGAYSMDISGISGAHYITFHASGSGAQRVSVSKVWME